MALEPGTRTGRFEIKSALAAVLAVTVVLLGYGGFRWYGSSRPSIGPRAPLLLADFVNTTDEAVFDGALKDALGIQLQQSPYLNVLPSSLVRAALRTMDKAPGEKISTTLARDLCRRLGAKAILLGSIAPLGSAYVIGLGAQSCESGDTLAREQAQAASKTDVLAAVTAAAARLREQLGESPASIQRFNVPAQNAATSSLDALKAYSMGLDTLATMGDQQAIPLFEHALELDPNFALAAARLGAIYSNLHDVQQGQHYMKQAFSASESLSEPERLIIKALYNSIVTGRMDDVIGTYQLWAQTYPQDWVPHHNLSAAYFRMNRLEEALTEARVAVKLAAGQEVVPYQQLARTLQAMDRPADVKAALAEAEEHGLDSSFNRAILYRLAFLDGDSASMQKHLEAAGTRADGFLVVAEAARAAAAAGAIDKSRTLFSQAIEAAQTANVADYAGSLKAEQAVNEALIGERDEARRDMFSAVDISNGPDTLWMASLAASFSGLTSEAMQLAGGYAQAAPPAPDVEGTLRPILEAGVALITKDGKTALEALNRADPFARASDPWVPYLRGLSYLALRENDHAIAQFKTVVSNLPHQAITVIPRLARGQLERLGDSAASTKTP